MRQRHNSDLDLPDSTYASLTPSPPTMLDPDLDHIHDLLVSLAKSAGVMLMTASTFTRTFTPKANTADLVTETDHAIERMLSTALHETYPDYKFLGEETHIPGSTAGLTLDPTFVVDPIDGTLNFVHGYPYTSISLAFVSKRLPLVGVVYNPFTSQLYSAIAGCGAHLHVLDCHGNIQRKTRLPLRQPPPALTGLQNALVAVEWGNERKGNNWRVKSQLFAALAACKEDGGAMVQSIRSLGSAALNVCAVADGTVDLYWQAGCWVWDVAAGWIILKEAGGIVASANPGDWEPRVDGRMYCFVRGARGGQEEVVEELWGLVRGRVEYPVS
ncbi:MAG: hypothetical protein FRX48_01364 [Lasallia pustulata]|uniref:Inositol-1-monophosphatase n=1 Tax=Lasallia pustulata TaxID=136370 RepID=A0A5M8Q0W3_9LECA|nr:MAG: hypothetical protein FRX48_01364 [Lasallia pustulata]